MKRIIAFVIVAAIALAVLVSCGGVNDALLGKWQVQKEGENVSFEFKSDGTYVTYLEIVKLTGHYSVSGDEIDPDSANFIADSVDKSVNISGKFKIEGDTLTFFGKDGAEDLVLKRAAS